MSQDQLTRKERIRLEAYAQAVMTTPYISKQQPTVESIMETAKVIEQFLLAADHTGN